MGMLDYYEPSPELNCPRCGRTLTGWQGSDGDCALFLWRQGVRHPISQSVAEESRLTDRDLQRFVLPDEFWISTHCTCSTRYLIEAVCRSRDGLWIQSELIKPEQIHSRYKHLQKAQREAIRRWLTERV